MNLSPLIAVKRAISRIKESITKRKANQLPPLRVIIFGTHSQDWMDALSLRAPVWKRIPSVRQVLLLDGSRSDLPPLTNNALRTVVLPLMEDHISHCPSAEQALLPTPKALRSGLIS